MPKSDEQAKGALGFAEDQRDYTVAVQMLHALGVERLDLLSNNPDKAVGLAAYGVHVSERVPIIIEPTEYNLRYLQTKAERMGHDLPDLLTPDALEERA